MSRRASPTLIGAFVAGAVVLSVVAVIMFSSGRYFHKTYRFVLFFSSSVNGLRVGAPVKFRGVEVGSVEDIQLQLDTNTQVQHIPVIIEVDPDKLTSRGGSTTILNDPGVFESAIEHGLRGQLQLESIVTGVLFVALDLFPGSPVRLVQQPGTQKYRYREIPTQPTALAEARDAVTRVLANLAQVDFKGFVDSATRAVTAVNQLVSSPDLKAAVRSIDTVTQRMNDAVANVSRLAMTLDRNVKSLSGDIHVTSGEARTAIKQATEAIRQTQATINDSPTIYELNRSLKEIAAAARSVRLLTDYLEGNPRALLFGKPATKEE
jgi:paraquat-inducible protein B